LRQPQEIFAADIGSEAIIVPQLLPAPPAVHPAIADVGRKTPIPNIKNQIRIIFILPRLLFLATVTISQQYDKLRNMNLL